MSADSLGLDRRRFLCGIGGLAMTVSLGGCLGDGDDGDDYVSEEPDYGTWFDDVPNYERTRDWRDRSSVTVKNGTGDQGIEYDPPAILVDAGATVRWEWTGRGGAHTVTDAAGTFDSGFLSGEGAGFEHTFSEPGLYQYYCRPHLSLGQKGAVVVE